MRYQRRQSRTDWGRTETRQSTEDEHRAGGRMVGVINAKAIVDWERQRDTTVQFREYKIRDLTL